MIPPGVRASLIHGIGLDVVDVRRMQVAYRRFSVRLAARLLHAAELPLCARQRRPHLFLAKRLAAKEALLKALGIGLRDGLAWSQVRVYHTRRGQPVLDCQGRAGQLLTELGVGMVHLSITDERHYVLAFVVLEKQAPTASSA